MDTTIIAGLGGAILGGVVSGYATNYFMNGKPNLLLTSVNISLVNKNKSAYQAISQDIFCTPDKIYTQIMDCSWLKSSQRFFESHTEYVNYLLDASQSLQRSALPRKDAKTTLWYKTRTTMKLRTRPPGSKLICPVTLCVCFCVLPL